MKLTEDDKLQLNLRENSSIEKVDDANIVRLLEERDGLCTYVHFKHIAPLAVYNIVYGYDMEDPYAHITANFSPNIEGEYIHFFFTYAISKLIAAETGEELFKAPSV